MPKIIALPLHRFALLSGQDACNENCLSIKRGNLPHNTFCFLTVEMEPKVGLEPTTC